MSRKPAVTPARGAAPDGPADARDEATLARRRVLLVDCLDAHGATREDSLARERALEPVAGVLQTLVLEQRSPQNARQRASEQEAMRAELERALKEMRPDVVVVAATCPETSPLIRALPRAVDVYGWPTAVGGPRPGWRSRKPRPGLPFAALGGSDGEEEPSYRGGSGLHPAGTAALDWGVHDPRARGRTTVPLWDGRYLLVPAPLQGGAGHELLRVFAGLDARWDRVELVVLGPVQPEFRMAARRLSVAARVHFAGAATPEAELTWLKACCGVVLAHPGPIAASFVLRALACGAPVLALGSGAAATVHGWLADRGAIPLSWASAFLSSRAKLEHMLEHDRAVQGAVERGRVVAARHAAATLSERLGAVLGLDAARRRRAA